MNKEECFIESIQKHRGMLYKLSAIYATTEENRKDLVQEIIFQLWKSFDSFKGNSALSTWIYRVAMNVGIYHSKKEKQHLKIQPLKVDFLNISQVERDDFEEQWSIVQKHINELSLPEKGLLFLYLENKSHQEIADIIGISKSNVGTRLSRIKLKLKKNIKNN